MRTKVEDHGSHPNVSSFQLKQWYFLDHTTSLSSFLSHEFEMEVQCNKELHWGCGMEILTLLNSQAMRANQTVKY
jgi:hypothetical protein